MPGHLQLWDGQCSKALFSLIGLQTKQWKVTLSEQKLLGVINSHSDRLYSEKPHHSILIRVYNFFNQSIVRQPNYIALTQYHRHK